jgi:hypothetical protein
MKEIILATKQNSFYRDRFLLGGFNVTEIDLPVDSSGEQKFLSSPPGSFAVFEACDETINGFFPLFMHGLTSSIHFVLIAEKFTDEIKLFLQSKGISDLCKTGDDIKLFNYIDAIQNCVVKNEETFLVLDDSITRTAIIRSIIERFNYSVQTVLSIDDFFSALETKKSSVALINLGTRGFDLGAFIRKSISSAQARRSPIIPFKDMKDGLFVHEFISGLNRIARVILSTEELYSFLIHMLFRRELFPLIDRLNRSIEFTNLMNFAVEPLPRIYFSLGMEAYTLDNIFTEESFGSLNDTIELQKKAIIKTEGIRWLVRNKNEGSTCGPGV